jgi:hypothetical protein
MGGRGGVGAGGNLLDKFLGLKTRDTPSHTSIFWFKNLADLVRMHPAMYQLGNQSQYGMEQTRRPCSHKMKTIWKPCASSLN